MVHNMLHKEHDHQAEQADHGNQEDGDGWKNGIDLRLFYSFRNFLKKQMEYNMDLRG